MSHSDSDGTTNKALIEKLSNDSSCANTDGVVKGGKKKALVDGTWYPNTGWGLSAVFLLCDSIIAIITGTFSLLTMGMTKMQAPISSYLNGKHFQVEFSQKVPSSNYEQNAVSPLENRHVALGTTHDPKIDVNNTPNANKNFSKGQGNNFFNNGNNPFVGEDNKNDNYNYKYLPIIT